MKKITSTILLTLFLLGLMVPLSTAAQPGAIDTCKLKYDLKDLNASLPGCDCKKTTGTDLGVSVEDCGLCCIVNTIYNVADWIFYLMLIATVVLVVVGGAMYMMSAGDAEKAGKGKSIIIYGIIGLGIAVFAKAVPSIVKLILAV